MQSEREDKRARLDLQRRELLLKEFEMGLITTEEYRSEVYGSVAGGSSSATPELASPVSPASGDDTGDDAAFFGGVGGSDDIVGSDWIR